MSKVDPALLLQAVLKFPDLPRNLLSTVTDEERRQGIDALLTWWNTEIYPVLPRGTRRGADGRLHLPESAAQDERAAEPAMLKRARQTLLVTDIDRESTGVVIAIRHSYATDDDLLNAIRTHLRAWAQTDEGQQARQEACEDFNWGDFAEWGSVLREQIPGVLDIVYLYPSPNNTDTAIIVDHDELLMVEE